MNTSSITERWWQRWLLLSAFLPVGVLGYSQTCKNLAGGTSFKPTVGHESELAYSINNVALDGPNGNFLTAGPPQADSLHAFHPDSTRFIYAITDSLPRLVKTFPMADKPAYVTSLKCEKLSPLVSFTVTSLKPGTTVKVSGNLGVLYADPDDKNHRVSYDGGATYSYMDWNCPNLQIGVPGSFDDLKVPYSEGDVSFEYEYELGPAETSITFVIQTGHNFNDYDYIAIYDIKVNGCINPIVASSQGPQVCEGEQTLFSLNKEYNAASYKWEWNEGGGWETIGTKKNVLKEITKKGSVRCTVDGIVTDVYEVEPITCCEVNGMPASRKTVFYEDFGYFKDAHTYVDKDGNESEAPFSYRTNTSFNIPMHDYDDGSGGASSYSDMGKNGQVNDGTYAVLVPTPNGYYTNNDDPNTLATWMNNVVADHSSALTGTANSAALFINVNKKPQSDGNAGYKGPIFESKIDGLCANKELTFETYIANLSGGNDPLVSIYILSEDKTKTYGRLENVVASGANWVQMKIEDLIIPDATSVILQVVADCGSKCNDGQYWDKGNDLIIDDIKFMTCAPPSINIYSDLENFTQDTTICSDAVITMKAPTSKLLENYFGGNMQFLYQASVDGGASWSNLDKVKAAFYDVDTKLFPEEKEILIRVIVGSESALNNFMVNPNAVVMGDDCSDYSTSDPFIITRVGDIQMGADFSDAACIGAEVTLPGVTNPDIVSWKWLDAADAELVALTSDETEKDYTFTLDEDVVYTFVGYTADGCVGKRKYTMKTNPTASVTLDSTLLCGKTIISATVVPATAPVTWTLAGTALTETASQLVLEPGQAGLLTAKVVSVTGYCDSPVKEADVRVKEQPVVDLETISDFCANVAGAASNSPEAISIPTLPEEAGYTISWFVDEACKQPAPALADLEGSTAVRTYYYIAENADGCSDTSNITFYAKPTLLPEIDTTKSCGKTTVTVSSNFASAEYTWSPVKEGTSFDVLEGEDATYSVSTTADGYCKSAVVSVDVEVNKVPAAPIVKNLDFVINPSSSVEITEAATKNPLDAVGYSLQWVETTEAGAEPQSGWSTTTPSVALDREKKVYYYVRQLNADGCAGAAEKVTITVNSSPLPKVESATVCVGTAVDLLSLVTPGDPDAPTVEYTLNWYLDENAEKGPMPTVDVTKPGKHTYYVSQTSTVAPFPESNKNSFTVTVIGVDVPSVLGNKLAYCKGEDAVAISATKVEDPSNQKYADGFVWSLDGTVLAGKNTAVIDGPNTDVTETTTYSYSVYQT
ncbi:MAG: hypothetical protein MJZ28_01795, partial [Paludibacteraceae bacterium]|nr:hypothetical protein [Paludibacteraceae bacterium]